MPANRTIQNSALFCFQEDGETTTAHWRRRVSTTGGGPAGACGASTHESTTGRARGGDGETARPRDDERRVDGHRHAGWTQARGWRLEGGLRSGRADVNVTYFF